MTDRKTDGQTDNSTIVNTGLCIETVKTVSYPNPNMGAGCIGVFNVSMVSVLILSQ